MYPKRKDLFVAWSKAMVEGSTVGKPNYSPARVNTTKSKRHRSKRVHASRRKRSSRGKKD